MTKMKQGWECPKCGAVMSPYINHCVNCSGRSKQSNNKPKEVANVFQHIPLKGDGKTYIPAGCSINGVQFPNGAVLPYPPKKGYSQNSVLWRIYGDEFIT